MSNDLLQTTKATVLKKYRDADASGKSLLEELFGKTFFNQKITDRVKSFEDACTVKGADPSNITHPLDSRDEGAYKQLKLIVEALNEGWTPDWNNTNQRKWYPWFDMRAGFGFSYSGCDCWCAYSCVGSRLCFHSEELAVYAGKQFVDLYKDFLTISIDSNVKDNNEKHPLL